MVSTLEEAGKRMEGLSMVEPAWRTARTSSQLGPGHPLMLRVQARYALLLCQTRRCEDGMKVLRENVDLARTHHGSNSRVLGDALFSLCGGLEREARDFKKLTALEREAYGIAAATEPTGSLRRASLAVRLARSLLAAWRPDEVWPLLEDVRRGNENLPDGPLRSRATWRLLRLEGATLAQSGDTKKALARYAEVGREAKAEGDLWWQAMVRYHTEAVLRLEGDFRASEPLAEEGVRESRLLWREMDRFARRYELGELGAAKLGVGKYQEALAALDESQSNRSEVTGHPEPFLPSDAQHDLWRGQALLHLHRPYDARDQFERVVAFWRDFDPEHPMAAEAAWWYGYSLIATGDVTRGKAMVAEARPRLAASFLPHLRPLATAPAPIPQAAGSTPRPKAQTAAR
jgi:tetratricopeptide (TPR) repeat protein